MPTQETTKIDVTTMSDEALRKLDINELNLEQINDLPPEKVRNTFSMTQRIILAKRKTDLEKQSDVLDQEPALNPRLSTDNIPPKAVSLSSDMDAEASDLSPATTIAVEEFELSPTATLNVDEQFDHSAGDHPEANDQDVSNQELPKLRSSIVERWREKQKLYGDLQNNVDSENDLKRRASRKSEEERFATEKPDLMIGTLNVTGLLSKVIHDTPAQVEFLMKGPKGWIEAVQNIPHVLQTAQTVGDVVATTGLAAVSAPMLLKTIVTGWHDFKNGQHTINDIKNKIPELEKKLHDLKEVAHQLPEDVVKDIQVTAETQLEEMKTFVKHAKTSRKTGAAQMFSGSAILVKSALAATSKIATLAAAHSGASAATLGAVGTFATVAGATNMVLGPAAGAAVAYAGIKKYKTNSEKLNHLNEIVPPTSAFLESAVQEHPKLEDYKDKIETKLQQRIDFYQSNKRWNLHQAASGAIFGSASAGSGVVAIAVLAGAGALVSNPIGAGIIAGGVGTASIYMAVTAAHNIITAPKHEFYNKTMEGHAPGINKDFLASIDSLAVLSPDNVDEFLGVQTRSKISESQAKCNELVQDLLHENGTGKPYVGLYTHSTDSPELAEKRIAQGASNGGHAITGDNKNLMVRHKQAAWSGSSTIGRLQKPFVAIKNLNQGLDVASAKGKEAYAKSATYLTKTGYANHLKNPENDNAKVFENLGGIMAEQAKSYGAVIEAALKVLPVSLGLLTQDLGKELAAHAEEKQLSPKELEEKMAVAVNIYQNAAEAGDAHIEEQLAKYIEIKKLADTFKAFSNGDIKPTDAEKAQAIEAYMALRQGHFPEEHHQEDSHQEKPKLETSFEKLSTFLIEEEPKIYRAQKGTMPFVETYTTSMRVAMAQSLDLGKEVKTEISHTQPSEEELKTSLGESFKVFTGKNPSDKSILLKGFNSENEQRLNEKKPALSVDEFIAKRYKDREKKKPIDEMLQANSLIQKVTDKKSFSH